MIGRWLHRAVAALALILVVSGSAMFCAGTAWATTAPPTNPVLLFDNAAGVAKLVIPTPSCSAAIPNCHWMLYMNLPLLPHQPRVGIVIGTHGVLVLPLPKFCGVIQADALVGPLSNPATWVYKVGIRERVHTCGYPTTTTTTTTTTRPDPTTTTTTRPRSTTTTTVAPKVAATASSDPATTATTAALPFTEATSTSSTQPATAQLPFTGLDFKPLAILGSALVILGGLMLSTVESRRRMLQRATAIKLDDVKDGARRTSSWFLGQ